MSGLSNTVANQIIGGESKLHQINGIPPTSATEGTMLEGTPIAPGTCHITISGMSISEANQIAEAQSKLVVKELIIPATSDSLPFDELFDLSTQI